MTSAKIHLLLQKILHSKHVYFLEPCPTAGTNNIILCKQETNLFKSILPLFINSLSIKICSQAEQLAVYYAHDNRISCLEVSPDGTAVGTGSWDHTLRVRARHNINIIFCWSQVSMHTTAALSFKQCSAYNESKGESDCQSYNSQLCNITNQ